MWYISKEVKVQGENPESVSCTKLKEIWIKRGIFIRRNVLMINTDKENCADSYSYWRAVKLEKKEREILFMKIEIL